jgi:hypothetical protein
VTTPRLRVAFEQAVANIAALSDTDVFPLPVEGHIFHDRQPDVVSLLEDIQDNFEARMATIGPMNQSALALVGYTSFRWVTQLDPVWNAYFLGLVLAIAPEIESARLPESDRRVYSYRYHPDAATNRLFSDGAWAQFQRDSLERSRLKPFVLTCDIADFYARIYHHRLENALQSVDPNSDIPWRLLKLLTAFSNNTSYGLPVGGPAARILAELLLNRVDRLLSVNGLEFARYADDYHLFTDSASEAYGALLTLSELLLRNEGLTLQKAKTRIMSSEEFQSLSLYSAQDVPAVDGAARRFLTISLRFDPYSPTAEDDYESLKSQVEKFDIVGMLTREMQKSRVSSSLSRRLLQALQFVDSAQKEQVALTLVDNLENLAPVFTSVMRSLRDMGEDLSEAARGKIASQLRQLIASDSYLGRVDVNLAYLIRVMSFAPSAESEALLASLYERDVAAFVKRDIVLTMGRWEAKYWLSDKKSDFASMHPWVRRAFLIASFRLGDEGKHWRKSVAPTLTPLESLTRKWMEERVAAPGWEIPL